MGMVAFTKQIAIQNAEYGIRANVILPGLMDTPMAVDSRARAWNRPREEIAAERDARIPLGGKMGTAWDVGVCGSLPRVRRGPICHRCRATHRRGHWLPDRIVV